MEKNSDRIVQRFINDVSPEEPTTTTESTRRSTSKPPTPRQVCKPGSGPKSITEITKLRASKFHILINPKNFQKIYKNGKLSSLIIREPNLPNNQIRKYSLVQNKRFECQRCKEVKTEQVKKNRGYVFDTKTKKIQIANYFGNDNLLFVSKKHSITCCKPFSANDSEFSNLSSTTTASKDGATPGPSTAAAVAQNIVVVPQEPNPNTKTITTINFKPIGSASASSENCSVIKAAASNSATIQPSIIPSNNEIWNQLNKFLAAAADNHETTTTTTTPMEISPNVLEATTEAVAAVEVINNNITEGAENGGGEEEDDDEEMKNIPPREISTGALPEITVEIIPVKAEQFSQGLTTEQNFGAAAQQHQQVAADEKNESLKFYRPSEFKLNECCKKLNIKYDRKAYQIWANINNIEIIKSFSNSIKPMKNVEPMGGFQGLSILFTGSSDAFHFISLSINKQMSERYPNISGDILFSSTITETHFAFICEFLSCRIGIYENGNLTKFGSVESWENNDRDILTILLQKVNDGINGYLPITKV